MKHEQVHTRTSAVYVVKHNHDVTDILIAYSLQLPEGIRARANPFSLAATGGISIDFFSTS